MSLLASKGLSSLLGFFFTFAGVSKTSGVHGFETPMSEEMQSGFRNGEWGDIFGLPSIPFLYAVGVTEVFAGLAMMGYTFGLVDPKIAQWAAAGSAFIALNGASAHIVRGDPVDKAVFCGVLFTLFTVLNFAIASSRCKTKTE